MRSGGLGGVARKAGSGRGPLDAEVMPRGGLIGQAMGDGGGVSAGEVAAGAIAAIADIGDVVVIVDAAAVTDDGEVVGQVGAGVNLVDQGLEVDGFGDV